MPRRTVRDTIQNVLVTQGGMDRHNLMPRLLDFLHDLPGKLTVTAIVGLFFDNRAEVEAMAKSCRRSVRLVHNPDSVRDLMLEADLAILAGGQTLYELAAVGTPTAVVRVTDNQADNLRVLAAEGVVRMTGYAGEAGLLDRVREAMRALLARSSARAEMSAAGQRLVDGRGAWRVAEATVCTSAAGEGETDV